MNPLRTFDLTPKEAVALQNRLRDRVVAEDRFGTVRTVAGVDVHYDRATRTARAAAVLLGFPGLEPLGESTARREVTFPYVPGLLSFREIPAALAALEGLPERPDLLLADAHGLAHPRRFGLACHLGLVVEVPTIGVAKSRLVGQHEEPPPERGAWVPLVDQGETVGAVVRTRTRVLPLYVSVGHRVSLESAIDLVLRCGAGYRLPEPGRLAHRLAGRS